MFIVVTGTRGIPGILGGIETHCEQLYPRLVNNEREIVVIRRSCYVTYDNKLTEFRGVKLKDLYAPHQKSFEAIIHTFLAVIWAKMHRADIVHIHAVGPGIITPLARLLRLKVVFTHHGPDYDRAKWGKFARTVLKMGEKWAVLYANEVIVISDVIKKIVINKYNRYNTHLIFNGVLKPAVTADYDYLQRIGISSHKYIFALGRFVSEKGFDLLIRAFTKLQNKDIKLVIAGDSDHETDYSKQLKEMARNNNVILPGFVKGEKLQQLFSHARLFVLPSYHEGLPISLLEAMSYRLPVLVSDIPANKQIDLPAGSSFVSGDEDSLYERLLFHLSVEYKPIEYDLSPYDWDRIALQTKSVYEQVINRQSVLANE